MPTAEQNSIPHSTADKLIAAHDGDVALLYIWLDLNGGFNADRAARELCRTEAEIKNAHEKLLRMGLSRPAAKPEQEIKLPPAEELPEYTSADIVRRSKEDSGFQAVIAQAQHKLGRVLSTADLKTLFGIYDYLALPADVIFMLNIHDDILKNILDTAKEFKVDGVVYTKMKNCDLWGGESIFIDDKIREAGLGLLILDREEIVANAGQVGIRAEAFVEMIETGGLE